MAAATSGFRVGSLASKRGYHTVSCELWSLSEKEGAGSVKANARTNGAHGVEGPGSAAPQYPRHSLRAGRDLERKERGLAGLLLGPAARVFLASKELSALF